MGEGEGVNYGGFSADDKNSCLRTYDRNHCFFTVLSNGSYNKEEHVVFRSFGDIKYRNSKIFYKTSN